MTPPPAGQIKAIGLDLFGPVVNMSAPDGDPQMLELVTQLRRQGYKLGLLSNVSVGHDQMAEYQPIFKLFDVALLSSEIGAAKPAPAAYLQLVQGLGVQPAETVFIDDWRGNVEGAQAVGMQGITYRSFSDLRAALANLGVHLT